MRTHIDIFSGIGGFSIAAESCGLETIAFAEIDPYACMVLKKHWPNVRNYGDVNNVTGISAWLLTGGPPCQPASVAGQRKGTEDNRWLWPATIACVERIKPVFCLFENPYGFITLNDGLEFERVLSKLESLGYSIQTFVIPAIGVGAQHRRDRVWIVAHSNSEWKLQSEGIVKDERGWIGNEDRNVSDANSIGLDTSKIFNPKSSQSGIEESKTRPYWSELSQHFPPTGLPLEALLSPETCGMPYGLSDGVDRIRCLGNAIVPQLAARIIRGIIESEEATQ